MLVRRIRAMRRYWWLALALVAATLCAYGPLGQNEFIRLDDPAYLTENPHVLKGLTSEGFAWAFNVGYTGNWHPLTWLSHMLDVSWWGLDAGAHHATNLALHASSVVVLFLLLVRMTDRPWPSAFVAAVFAVHPLHVESVAWAAERKDVLSTLLGFLSIACWVDWTKKGGAPRYLASLALFALSLTAKSMFVTLPFLLLLLDRWPLARARSQTAGLSLAERIREKLPFFALVLASCVLTMIAQKQGRAMTRLASLSLDDRFGNALSASLAYLEKAFWPSRLAVFYPHPFGRTSAYRLLGGGLAVACGLFAALRGARRFPWLTFGLLWWFGMLVPVIGLVQVGGQSMADRYTYAPMVGLSIVVAWGAGEIAARWSAARVVAWVLALAVIGGCIAATRVQVGYWKDDPTLFQHALDVTENNYLAHFRLAADAWDGGRREEALAQYAETVRLAPDMPEAHNNYGAALLICGRTDEAIVEFAEAVRTEPDVGDPYFNLAAALLQKGRVQEAIPYLKEGVRLRPDLEDKRRFLEQLLQSQRAKEAASPK
jgi:tetratricopeptide (TPR) repeat protein